MMQSYLPVGSVSKYRSRLQPEPTLQRGLVSAARLERARAVIRSEMLIVCWVPHGNVNAVEDVGKRGRSGPQQPIQAHPSRGRSDLAT